MSYGYNSQSLTYPGLKLQEILLYVDISKIQKDCTLFGLTFTNENVLFQKAKFNDNELLASCIDETNAQVVFARRTLTLFFLTGPSGSALS